VIGIIGVFGYGILWL